LINDAASDPRIYRPVEIKSGFITSNMICVPLKTMERSLGVLYALNKVFGSFDQDDVEILLALSGNVALALENAEQYENLTKSYKELERLHLVKTKILNHLSHELKTPLAIIEASLKNMERRMKAEGIDSERFPFDRMLRNVGRLRTIEKQVGDIVGERDDDEPRELLALLEDLKDIIEVQQEDQPNLAEALTALACKIEQLLPGRIDEKEGILITEAFEQARLKAEKETGNRILDIRFLPPDPAIIKMQPQIMMSVIEGLVRNAVENTPDHGKIVIKGENRPSGYIITVTDFGVGIPEGDQPNIFEGFYPVRESNHYRSGSRYAFYAGGTGTDLLKIKIFAERFGFKISFQSRRCSCIPTIKDLCPGDITRCRCCKKIEDCFDMGGTEFAVEMPPDLVDTEQTDV
jgi:signal transduction histidine kinase